MHPGTAQDFVGCPSAVAIRAPLRSARAPAPQPDGFYSKPGNRPFLALTPAPTGRLAETPLTWFLLDYGLEDGRRQQSVFENSLPCGLLLRGEIERHSLPARKFGAVAGCLRHSVALSCIILTGLKRIADIPFVYLSDRVKISVKTDYACRVLTEMARMHGSGKLAQIEHLARVEAVPANFLAQILSELRNGGLITSRRGIQGGYTLARPPEQITLYDILKVVEGEIIEFSGNREGRTGRRMEQVWMDMRETLEEKARSYTLDALVTRGTAEMYHI